MGQRKFTYVFLLYILVFLWPGYGLENSGANKLWIEGKKLRVQVMPWITMSVRQIMLGYVPTGSYRCPHYINPSRLPYNDVRVVLAPILIDNAGVPLLDASVYAGVCLITDGIDNKFVIALLVVWICQSRQTPPPTNQSRRAYSSGLLLTLDWQL